LDRYLVDFALSAPESFKLRDGISKEPLKRLAERYVGHEAVYRPKLGFGLPIQEWVGAEVGQHMRSILDADHAEVEEYFNVPYLKDKLDRPLSTVNQAFQLWVVYNFLNWRRAYFC
jgi:asparagine synthase (glutamine-hydrolysing)